MTPDRDRLNRRITVVRDDANRRQPYSVEKERQVATERRPADAEAYGSSGVDRGDRGRCDAGTCCTEPGWNGAAEPVMRGATQRSCRFRYGWIRSCADRLRERGGDAHGVPVRRRLLSGVAALTIPQRLVGRSSSASRRLSHPMAPVTLKFLLTKTWCGQLSLNLHLAPP